MQTPAVILNLNVDVSFGDCEHFIWNIPKFHHVQFRWAILNVNFYAYVMHSNETGNMLHRPILRYGQLKLAQGEK